MKRRRIIQPSHQLTLSTATVDEGVGSKAAANANPERKAMPKRSQAFLVSTLLTFTVFVCWTALVLYTSGRLIYNFSDYKFYNAALVLHTLQSTLDPIYFIAALPTLRAIFCCGSCEV